jgi:hypothetical protein
MMVADHERALKEAGSAGDTAAAATPVGQPAVDAQAKHEQTMNTLRTTAKGRAFDSTYIAMMVTGHQDVLARLEGMKGAGNSPAATPAATPGATPSTTGGTTGGTAAGSRPATGNPGAVGSAGTTQAAGSAVNDPMHTHVQNSIDMVRTHLERAQEIQRSLQSGS